ncbi:hypothetical protein ABL78_8507 [Leptomonas seymouri]|uniref:Uncharacterized protein n=1 Tax=Leptomonas seymouri TaxID=5684 RepID=A0A0N1P968_LEPSE|nr:hypothetical protein ABL78_8507 [Leptomonas seymouri]|eukprot:KPI82483.1 hypothetical protein ABL78_8507 [Leptomonas seymouri]
MRASKRAKTCRYYVLWMSIYVYSPSGRLISPFFFCNGTPLRSSMKKSVWRRRTDKLECSYVTPAAYCPLFLTHKKWVLLKLQTMTEKVTSCFFFRTEIHLFYFEDVYHLFLNFFSI